MQLSVWYKRLLELHALSKHRSRDNQSYIVWLTISDNDFNTKYYGECTETPTMTYCDRQFRGIIQHAR